MVQHPLLTLQRNVMVTAENTLHSKSFFFVLNVWQETLYLVCYKIRILHQIQEEGILLYNNNSNPNALENSLPTIMIIMV